jgi:hypothetical protein
MTDNGLNRPQQQGPKPDQLGYPFEGTGGEAEVRALEEMHRALLRRNTRLRHIHAACRRVIGPDPDVLVTLPPEFRQLFQAFSRAVEDPPVNLREALEELPPGDAQPVPWTTWLFVTLFAYRERQRWARASLVQNLPQYFSDPQEDFSPIHADEISVPNMPEWQYEVYCRYAGALVNRVTSESVSVSRYIEVGENIVTLDDFSSDLASRSRWEPAARFPALRLSDSIPYAIKDLTQAGLIVGLDERGQLIEDGLGPFGYTLTEDIAGHSEAVLKFCEVWADPDRRLWLSALIGDWISTGEIVADIQDTELAAIVARRANDCRDRQLRVV